MVEEVSYYNENEKQLIDEMLFTLSDRDNGTFAIIVTDNEKKRQSLYTLLKVRLKEYHFYDLDLAAHSYTSIYRLLQDLLPPEIQTSKPVQYLISVTGLENSLFETVDGNVKLSTLTAQMNFEREFLFSQPYIILLWAGAIFDSALRQNAPDLMHWVSKRFVFDGKEFKEYKTGDDTESLTLNEPEGFYFRKIKDISSEQEERIQQLSQTWRKLNARSAKSKRLIKDKINTLILLSREFNAAFEYEMAINALNNAILLNKELENGFTLILFFELASTYYSAKRYNTALTWYEKALALALEQNNTTASAFIRNAIGMTYAQLQEFDTALLFLQDALKIQEKIGDKNNLGRTFKQIGHIYAQQLKWNEALLNYQKALDLQRAAGDNVEIGETYYFIGQTLVESGKPKDAEDFFNRSIKMLSQNKNPLADKARKALALIQRRNK